MNLNKIVETVREVNDLKPQSNGMMNKEVMKLQFPIYTYYKYK